MTSKPQIIVDIDFNTTYSGCVPHHVVTYSIQFNDDRIAWSLTAVADDIEVISEWPGRRKRTTPKAPTTICYEGGKVRWGYGLTFTKDVIHGVKLLLDERLKTDFIPVLLSKKVLRNRGLSPAEVYVLTVPAVWSDKAKDGTRLATSAAGFPLSDISLVSEPEAAALHCLSVMKPNTIQSGDVIVVCDAGGGTVDLISYCVKSVSPLYLEEVTQGTGMLLICIGAAYGSMLLDAKFMTFLKALFGDSEYEKIPRVSIQAAISFWQVTVKPNYSFDENDDDDNDEFQELGQLIPLPGVGDKLVIGLKGGFLALDRIFESVVENVVSLVHSQTRDIARSGAKAKAIMLVGGFAESEYLYQRLKAACPLTPVMQPTDACAVQRGLDGNRVSIWSDIEQGYFVKDRLTWYIMKNAAISENTPRELPLVLYVRPNKDLRDCQSLFVCYADIAPNKVTEDVFKLCKMEFDLNDIPTTLFPKKRNCKGFEYYRIEIVAKLTPTSAPLLFELDFDGVPYGSITVRY
ncbi:actin-like ATPase domain-containing protein [Aspergillus caelatus]|uniref:Actin-like ATPase domain-containing protein n=1 Tax=Aspergillus caelatus TaxID=61420 RepID=A0A5N6ZNY1_9EURO|nr:actin-like ATPase domain-containing protein [Aspergillus caelatus]KAE8359145.1 actin-like ATPase domain-containing protein [Aspergillus caelatus]